MLPPSPFSLLLRSLEGVEGFLPSAALLPLSSEVLPARLLNDWDFLERNGAERNQPRWEGKCQGSRPACREFSPS